MKFYLGTHTVCWLWTQDKPIFISTRRLERNKKLRTATCDYAIDSGGFTELSMYGKWTVTPKQYVERIKRYRENLGEPDFIAQQDWMCEDFILEKTRKTIEEHQRLTVENFLDLKSLIDAPIIPVIQGYYPPEYDRHIEMFFKAGVDLTKEPLVGIGSVCRRQATNSISDLVTDLTKDGINLHGFGVKLMGLKKMKNHLSSADSMAWSFNARGQPPITGHPHLHCNNCLEYAHNWRDRLLSKI